MSNYVSVQTVAAAAYGYYSNDYSYFYASLYGDYVRGNTEIRGPDAADLTIPTSQYGVPIGWGFGGPRVAPQVWWASEKRANVTTTGGKGSGPEPEVTTVTREIDLLLGLGEFQAKQISRIWMNGKVVWTRREGASEASLAASDGSNLWRRLTFYDGNASQLPDADYEAAVGVGNAPAYRGRTTVFIKGLQLGNSGVIPAISFEVVVSGIYTLGAAAAGPTLPVSAPFVVGTAAASSGATFRVLTGTWDNNYSTTSVLVYDVDLLSGATTQLGFFGAAVASPVATGNSDVPCLMVFSLAGTTAYMYTDADGAQVILTLPELLGSSQVRFARLGSTLVVGSTLFGSRRLYRFNMLTGGAVVQQSDPLPDFVQSLLILPDGKLYAAARNSAAIYVLDPTTLALESTITRPVWENWDQLFALDRELAYLHASAYGVRVYRGGAFVQLGTLPSIYVPQSDRCPSIGVVGGLLVGGLTDSLTYRTWKAPIKVEPTGATVAEVVDDVCRRAGMPAGSWDTSALATITRRVRSLAIGQVMPARAVLEQVSQAFFFEPVLRDKLYFRPRGAAPVATISWRDLGAAVDQAEPQPFSPQQNGELELPPVIAAQYINVNDDAQAGLEKADRMVAGQAATQVVRWAIGMTPAEAKAAVDALVVDSLAALLRAQLALPLPYTYLEAGDVVQVTSRGGRTYRLRLGRMRQQRGVIKFEALGDDPSALVSAGITDATQTITNEVAAYADTLLEVLDVPLLRDVDDVPGVYVAARGVASPWPGCAVLYSTDGISFDRTAAEVDESAIIGTATTTLAAYTGAGFDEVNALTVNVGVGELETVTRNALLADPTLNVLLVGSEVLRYLRAQQVSAGVYTLTGLLRGRRGTEWAQAGHASGERVVALRARGLRRLEQQQPELGRVRTVKGVTRGATVDDAAAVSFTNTGASQKPLAPVDLRAVMTTAGAALRWKRRTRLQATFGGAGGSYRPLGEDAEAYDVELRDGSAQLVQSARVSTPEWLVPGASSLVTFDRAVVEPHEHGGALFGLEASTVGGTVGSLQRLLRHSLAGALEAESFVLGDGPVQVAFSGGTAWVAAHQMAGPFGSAATTYSLSRLMRVDLSSISAAAATWSPATPGELSGVAYDGADVWTVAPIATNNLRRHNASTLAVLNTYSVGAQPFAVRHAGGVLFVSFLGGGGTPGSVKAIDPATGSVLWTRNLDLSVYDLACTGPLVFAAAFDGVAVLDATTGAVVQRYTDGAPAGFTAFSLALFDGDVVYRPALINAAQRPFRVLDGTTGAISNEVPAPQVSTITGQVGSAAYGANASGSLGYTLQLLPALSGYTVTVWQVSAAVGRGFPTSLTL